MEAGALKEPETYYWVFKKFSTDILIFKELGYGLYVVNNYLASPPLICREEMGILLD